MDIITATQKALESNRCIRRESWEGCTFAVLPTDLCFEMTHCNVDVKKQKHRPLWNPKTEDVLADDWCVVD